MTTLGDMKGRIKQILQGYTRNQEQISWLAQATLATDTQFFVNPGTASQINRGLVEIDNELILIDQFNSLVGTMTTAAGINGRGQEGTTPAFHDMNSIITMDPDFPRQRITEAINDTIRATYPDLYVMKSFDFPYKAARFEYEFPADAEKVYKVTISSIGPSFVWKGGVRWRFNPQASTQSNGSSTGKSIQIMDPVVPGRLIHCMYIVPPNILVNDTDDFAITTGYPDRYTDMIQYGATARLLSSLEPARLAQKAVESTERAPLVPAGAATNSAQYFWNLYKQRYQEETDRLHDLFPAYQHILA
jgi:hypothetical protein